MAIYFDNIQGDVASIFLSYFKRAPEFEAMQHYVAVLEALQKDPATVGNAFNLLAAHIYADAVYTGEVPAGPTITDTYYVTYLYSNVLGRLPDTGGRDYWVEQLQLGTITRAELVGTFVAAALGAGGRDTAYLENRTEVATEFALWANSNPQLLPTLKYNAAQVLEGVNEDPATVVAAQARLETSSGNPGETRNLTPEVDTIEGTTGNDTYNAVFTPGVGGNVATLTVFDSIDGDLGTDTFNIYVAADGANGTFPDNATVRNVEIVNVYDAGRASGTSLTDASNYQGVQQLWQINTTKNVMALGAATVAGFRNVKDLDVAVLATADAKSATIALENVGQAHDAAAVLVDGASLAAVNVSGTLHAGSEGLELAVEVGNGVNAVTINTAVATNIVVQRQGVSQPLVQTLDMAGSAGDIHFEASDSAITGVAVGATLSFGFGNDRVVFDSDRALSLRDNVNGGQGRDTLVLELNGTVQTQTYDAIDRTTNFEVVAFAGAGVDPSVVIDAAQLSGFEAIELMGTAWYELANLSSDVQLVRSGTAGDFSTVILTDADADVNVTLEDGVGLWLFSGDEDAAPQGGTLTVDGKGAVETTNETGFFSVFDTSDLTGELFLIHMSVAVAETIILGEEVEGFFAVMMSDEVPSSSTLQHTDTIVGFDLAAEGGDGIGLHGGYYTGRAVAQDLSAEASFQEAMSDAAAAFGASGSLNAGDVLVFLFGGSTYLYSDTIDTAQGVYDNGDFLLKLQGFTDIAGLAEDLSF